MKKSIKKKPRVKARGVKVWLQKCDAQVVDHALNRARSDQGQVSLKLWKLTKLVNHLLHGYAYGGKQ